MPWQLQPGYVAAAAVDDHNPLDQAYTGIIRQVAPGQAAPLVAGARILYRSEGVAVVNVPKPAPNPDPDRMFYIVPVASIIAVNV